VIHRVPAEFETAPGNRGRLLGTHHQVAARRRARALSDALAEGRSLVDRLVLDG
jgi:hypothetical protein